jgi:hypothetical protein
MKSFLLLALPDDHPFWTAEAAPMPALERLKPMPYANMLVQRRAGRVTAYAAGVNEGHGHGQFPEKYAKFAYDTRFGFLPQPGGAQSGGTGQYAGLCHRRQRVCA